jgi:hypothetical protein
VIELKPDEPRGHSDLGRYLRGQGRYEESLAAYQRAYELAQKLAGANHQQAASRVGAAERIVALAPRMPALLSGEVEPGDAGERIALALVCEAKRHTAAAAKSYAAAFAADPKLAEMSRFSRISAEMAAAEAGCGQGEDAGQLDGAERVRWRKQALNWLTADLAACAKRADTAAERPKVRSALLQWRRLGEFASVREAAALAKLPEDERVAWQKFWADVADLLKRTEEPPAAAQPQPQP